jgi:hypothetical protein
MIQRAKPEDGVVLVVMEVAGERKRQRSRTRKQKITAVPNSFLLPKWISSPYE